MRHIPTIYIPNTRLDREDAMIEQVVRLLVLCALVLAVALVRGIP